jgi:transposase-like protein
MSNRNDRTTNQEERAMRVYNRWNGDESGATVISTDYYCPNCGKQNVFVEEGEGDYYTGPTHYCNTCDYSFSIPSGSVNKDLKWDEKHKAE